MKNSTKLFNYFRKNYLSKYVNLLVNNDSRANGFFLIVSEKYFMYRWKKGVNLLGKKLIELWVDQNQLFTNQSTLNYVLDEVFYK